jgi:hypothetical protein
MTSESPRTETETDPLIPQDEFSDRLLAAEIEPTADGDKRALFYPEDRSGAELATRWMAAPESALVDIDDVQ